MLLLKIKSAIQQIQPLAAKGWPPALCAEPAAVWLLSSKKMKWIF